MIVSRLEGQSEGKFVHWLINCELQAITNKKYKMLKWVFIDVCNKYDEERRGLISL